MKKKILITGAAKNLGSYLVEHLAARGYEILLHYQSSHADAEMISSRLNNKGYDIEIVEGDFSNQKSIQDFLTRLQSKVKNLVGVIHNVGNFYEGSLLNTNYETWNDLIQINLTASFILLKELMPFLELNSGHIICMGFAGIDNSKADIYCPLYSLTKQALLFMVRSLAKEMASKGVKINMVSPGYLENSIVKPKALLPMKRLASFEDIFQTVKFLLNQTYITGQNIEVAGGVRL